MGMIWYDENGLLARQNGKWFVLEMINIVGLPAANFGTCELSANGYKTKSKHNVPNITRDVEKGWKRWRELLYVDIWEDQTSNINWYHLSDSVRFCQILSEVWGCRSCRSFIKPREPLPVPSVPSPSQVRTEPRHPSAILSKVPRGLLVSSWWRWWDGDGMVGFQTWPAT